MGRVFGGSRCLVALSGAGLHCPRLLLLTEGQQLPLSSNCVSSLSPGSPFPPAPFPPPAAGCSCCCKYLLGPLCLPEVVGWLCHLLSPVLLPL